MKKTISGMLWRGASFLQIIEARLEELKTGRIHPVVLLPPRLGKIEAGFGPF